MPDTPSIIESPALKTAPRVSRLRLLGAGILLLTVAGVFTVRILENRARDEIFAGYMENQTENCLRTLDDFYRPISGLLQLIPQWAASGILSFDDPGRIRDHFEPILDARDEVVALTIVGHDGRSYELRRVGGADTWKDSLTERADLDRRESPWYGLARAEDQIGRLMTTELPFPVDDDEPHLLAALAWTYPGEAEPRIGAAALEMTGEITRDLSEGLSVSKGSMVLVLAEGEIVTWLAPGEERHFEAAPMSQLTLSGEEYPGLITRALLAWSEQGRSYGLSFAVRNDRGEYWCRFLPLEVGSSRASLALLVPRSDIDAQLSLLTRPFQYALLGVILLGLVILAIVYQQYRRRIRDLRRHRAATGLENESLEALIAQGESERLEFKSTLRWNLKANKPGKEIEMAWLKTLVAYLNTEGGTLLVGVADDGSIVGMEQDGFKNEDKYLLHFNNCVKQHIGIEFARFLSFDLRSVGAKRVLVVDAQPAESPAFLVLDDEEEFYVRVGPASRKVSPRKALEYLRDQH